MGIVYKPAIQGLDAVSEISLAAVGSSPNANGASISSAQVLNLQPADGTNPGVVTTGSQTLAGVKTFSSAPNLSSLTASLPLKLDGSKNITAAAISLSGSEVTNALPETKGGTNQSTYTTGDTLYASASNTLSKLTIGSTGNVLTVAGGVPVWAPATITPFDSSVRFDVFNGYGSGNTNVMRFTTVTIDQGSDLTDTQSSTNGDLVTINTTGVYSLDLRVSNTLSGQQYQVVRNSTSSGADTAASTVILLETVAGISVGVSASFNFNATDVVRVVKNGAGGTINFVSFKITRVG